MRILSHVCAEFRNGHGLIIFQVPVCEKNAVVEAPEEIRSDPLFGMLVAEGSLEIIKDGEKQKELENDPTRGTDATGKKKTAKKDASVQETVGSTWTEVEVIPKETTDDKAKSASVSRKIQNIVKPEADEARV